MNDFQGLLSGDYGFKPQGKSAPMAPPRSNPSTANPAFDFDLGGSSTAAVKTAPYSKPPASGTFLDDDLDIFSSRKKTDFGNSGGLDDVFGGSSKSSVNSSVNLDSIFSGPGDSGSRFSSLPVFDKPVYDDEDDVFVGVSGLKNPSSAKYEDVFSSSSPRSSRKRDAFDDLLVGLGRKETEAKGLGGSGRKNEKDVPAFDDLLPGFGASAAPSERDPAERSWNKRSTVNEATKATSYVEDPFVVLNSSSTDAQSNPGLYDDPLDQFTKLGGSSSKKYGNVSATGGLFDDLDPLDGLGKPAAMNDREKVGSPARTGTTVSSGQTSPSVEASDRSSSARIPERGSEKNMPAEDYHEPPSFDAASVDSQRGAPNPYTSPYVNTSDETTSQRHTSTVYDNNIDSSDDVWLTVSEIPLFTQPTAAPPPSRPPPPKPARISKARAGSYGSTHEKKKIDDHSSFPNSAQSFRSPKSATMGGKSSFASPVDELEEFAKGRSWNDPDGNSDVLSGDDFGRHSAAAASAAAMKEVMERAEARFKHAKEVRERENAKATRMQQEREDKTISDLQEREFRERQEKQEWERQLREEEERKQKEEEERMRREREEREREQRRIERERIERERVRQAVERATREARERAAADARARAEKAAVEKAQTEARERAERAAVMKAQAEARERAARAAAEAKQRADREKAEREAREKATREAKEKEARDKAAAAAAAASSARANQQKNEDDLESFFGMGSRASSAPRPRASFSDPFFDSQFPKKQSESVRTSSTASMRKTSSSANIVDDLSSIFGGAPSAGAFQEVEGESEERRRARLERHQRTQERAAKALAEKNQRDLEAQNEQAERHRIAETLDVEIKRWAAGKEGNLRALLSTLQYVLWPECGWQPISLTDLITAAAVKKVYRKATLCIHPDKVQQKGATLQQKYIAEKVFDLLKEAWNKFNSEELF